MCFAFRYEVSVFFVLFSFFFFKKKLILCLVAGKGKECNGKIKFDA